jgi:hypothetical protein
MAEMFKTKRTTLYYKLEARLHNVADRIRIKINDWRNGKVDYEHDEDVRDFDGMRLGCDYVVNVYLREWARLAISEGRLIVTENADGIKIARWVNKKEEKERQHLVDTYLPTFILPQDSRIDATKLKVYLNSLSAWARSRSHYLRPIPGNEGWCSQLESLAQMCDTFVLLIDSSDMDQNADIRQMESWISTLFKGESFMQYAPQKGSRELIDSPAKMASHIKRTVWMNFTGGDSKHLDCSFLYPSEREKMKQHITMWAESEENYYNELIQLMPFLLTDDQLILVVTDYQDGEVSPKHPILVRLESQIENLSDFIVHPNLNEEQSDSVKLVRNNNTLSLIPFDHADLLKWPAT